MLPSETDGYAWNEHNLHRPIVVLSNLDQLKVVHYHQHILTGKGIFLNKGPKIRIKGNTSRTYFQATHVDTFKCE
jgi:hypothetical protein